MTKGQASTSLYFIGILPDESQREEITAMKREFQERYKSSHALKSPPHITLAPPFQVPAEKERQIMSILSASARDWSHFKVTMDNFGAFKPRVVFVHIVHSDHLEKLYFKLNDQLITLGLITGDKMRKSYHPHITLATRDLDRKMFYKAWEEFQNRSFQREFEAKGITLLKHNGKFWDVLETFPFAQ